MVCGPSESGVVGVNVHVPSGCTVAVPRGVLPSLMVMVLPGSPVPLIVGVVSLVSAIGLSVTVVTVSFSIVSLTTGALLPKASCALRVVVKVPSLRLVTSTIALHVPSGLRVMAVFGMVIVLPTASLTVRLVILPPASIVPESLVWVILSTELIISS